MAAVSLSPLPYDLSSMSTRRTPLSSNPNAVNSPCRALVVPISKQKRSYAHMQREDAYGQPPPTKKQMLDTYQVTRTPPRQTTTQSTVEGRILTRKSNASFERKAVVLPRETTLQAVKKSDKTQEHELERVRKWQKHYQEIFPTFVFYFESVPEDLRVKYTKQVVALGAREEKFFSNAVTHVVTTRSIPVQQELEASSATASDSISQNPQPQTINPSLLDRAESVNELGARAKFTFDISINRRPPHPSHDTESKRQQTRSSDVLLKARALGIKIWALEKLQRMMTTMFEHDTGHQAAGPNTRSHSVSHSIPRSARETDLSKLLRNERINGPSDRDPTVATKELILFKGPYLYIHDIDEKQKPIMVREYAKVQHKEDGDWPQFRSVSNGKCPFVGEIDYDREAAKDKERARAQQRQEKIEQGAAPLTRAASAAVESSQMQPPRAVSKRVFAESTSNRNMVLVTNQIDPFAPAKFPNSSSTRSHQNAFVSRAGAGTGRLFAGEPVASGVQPNITSAIRSQISSTAAQPGARVGTNKEIYGLQRKVLEKNSGEPASYGHASSHRMTDITAAARDDTGSQQGRRRNQHALAQVEEDGDPSEAEETAKRTVVTRKAKAEQQRKVVKKDAKPGYCENCQDKFDDFDEHVVSHKHRRFAEKLDNWRELDDLLNTLARAPRDNNEDDY